jgi:hypothetical protein
VLKRREGLKVGLQRFAGPAVFLSAAAQVQLMLTHRGPLDMVLHLEAVTMVDTHFARPATWRHEAGGGQQQQQPDLENGTHHRQVVVLTFSPSTNGS